MKKSLVLAMAMALGVTASAYAANPFSDVPAGHWAYDSISKLAAAGVVDGYPDGSFKGDNLMTRYEMAQIVAKAMAKGANVDALAAEFADELDNLGVRVAALEKKADNVKITGNIRYHYQNNTEKGHGDALRSRITLTGQINEDWKYTALFENQQKFASDEAADEKTAWQRAYINGKLGGLKVQAGRYHWEGYHQTNELGFSGEIYGNRMEGIAVEYGKAIQLKGTVGKMNKSGDGTAATYGDFWAGDISAQLGKAAKLNVGYYNMNAADGATVEDKEIINVGLKLNAGKNVGLFGEYLKLNSDSNTDGNSAWIAGIKYKGAKASQVGSWGMAAKWVDTEAGILDQAWNSVQKINAGGRGYGLLANYTVAKNIVAQVEYYNVDVSRDAKGNAVNGNQETIWSQVVFTF